MFGHIAKTPEGLIRKVQLDYYSDTNTRTAKREQRYTVVPKAKKDYNEDNVIDTADEPFIEPVMISVSLKQVHSLVMVKILLQIEVWIFNHEKLI